MAKQKTIYLSPPHMGSKELQYIQEAFDSNWLAPIGENLNQFEQSLDQYLGNTHSLALNSGTAALHLGLRLLGIKAQDQVLCPSFTFVASLNALLYQGAQPILIDSEKDTWNICPDLLEKAILAAMQSGNKPRAILVVHLYGQMAKMKEIMVLSEKYQIPILEDAAEALGSYDEQGKAGTLGAFGVLSFNGNKIISTSAGGALLCPRKAQRERALYLATQAKEAAAHYEHSEMGYNYRLSNVLAGIGRGQMQVLPQRIKKRRAIFNYYRQELDDCGLEFPSDLPGSFTNRWLSCILCADFQQREDIRKALQAENIESRPLWKPMHQQRLAKAYPFYASGVSDNLFERGLCLPSGSNLEDADLGRIVQCIRKTLSQ